MRCPSERDTRRGTRSLPTAVEDIQISSKCGGNFLKGRRRELLLLPKKTLLFAASLRHSLLAPGYSILTIFQAGFVQFVSVIPSFSGLISSDAGERIFPRVRAECATHKWLRQNWGTVLMPYYIVSLFRSLRSVEQASSS